MALGINVIYNMKPGKREEFLAAAAELNLREAVRGENGCLQYDYFCAAADPDQLLLVEKWSDAKAQEIHLTQPHMAHMPELKERFVRETVIEKYEI